MGRALARVSVVALVCGLTGPSLALAQDPVPTDAATDSAGIGELPGELVGALADSASLDTTFAVLPDLLRPDPGEAATRVIEWDRQRIRRSNAMTLVELLADMVPGLVTLRAGYFAGPAHVLDGPFGAGALRLSVDGRPVPALIGSQVDLTEYPLSTIDVIRVTRDGTGWQVELTTLRRTDRRAYSRVEAGSGDPDLESLRLVFTNGWGRALAVHAGFELLDAADPETGFQTFSGGASFMPGGGRSGVELQLRNSSFDREGPIAEAGSRNTLSLAARLQATDEVQASVWWSEATRELDSPGLDPDDGSEIPGRRDGTSMGGAELRGVWERGWATAGTRLADVAWLPSLEVSASAGTTVAGRVSVSGGAVLGDWDEFSSRELRGALSLALPWLGATIAGDVAGGVRGTGSALGTLFGDEPEVAPRADSVRFTTLGGRLDVDVGAVHLGAGVRKQKIDRQIGFGSVFDPGGVIGPEAEIVALEGRFDVPVLPLSWLLQGWQPLRIRGFARHNDLRSATVPFYVPENVVRGELYFEDEFLEGDLGLRLAIGLDRRDAWLVPDSTGAGTTVAARTSLDFDLGIRLVGVLVYWRVDNIANRDQGDLPGGVFPRVRQVFGIRWEFFD